MSFIYAHSFHKDNQAREEGVADARESIQGAIGSLVTFQGARKSKHGRIRYEGKTKNSRE